MPVHDATPRQNMSPLMQDTVNGKHGKVKSSSEVHAHTHTHAHTHVRAHAHTHIYKRPPSHTGVYKADVESIIDPFDF